MSFPDLLKVGWQDNVRALCGGVSTDDVPDSFLALDPYGPQAESDLMDLLPEWSDMKKDTNKAMTLNRAAIRKVAASVCDFCVIKFAKTGERIGGEYQYTMGTIDWMGTRTQLLNEYYGFIRLLDPDAIPSLNYCDVIIKDPAIYEDISFE